MSERESLYHKYPDYRVDLEPGGKRHRVSWQGQLIADSTRALIVRETNHAAVVYFPREDVSFDLLDRTEHQTFCPFKGVASYWTLSSGDQQDENAVWSYEDPFDQVVGLKDYVSFYPDRVDWVD